MSEQPRLDYTAYLRKCYDLNESQITRIVKLIETKVGSEPSIVVSLENSQSLSSKNIGSIIEDPTLETAAVKSINVTASNYEKPFDRRVSLNLEGSTVLGSIRLSIAGDRDFVNSLKQDLNYIIEASKKWYWPLNYTGNAFVLMIYLVIAAISAGIYMIWALSHFSADTAKAYPNLASAVIMLVFVAAIACVFSVRNYIFPPLNLRIGKSKRLAERRDQIRKFVFVTVIAGTGVSLFSNQIWEIIKPYIGSGS